MLPNKTRILAARRKRNAAHSEVLSGATFKPAASQKAAKAAARMHVVNGHRVKVGQSSGKWGCWVWPKKNPDYIAQAKSKGATLGRYIATIKTGRDRDAQTIERAAIAFVNKLPINNFSLEGQIKFAFVRSAKQALSESLKQQNPCKKRNPEGAAKAMREKFTGLPADGTIIASRDEHVHEHLAALGDLIELRGKTIKGTPFVIEFKRSANPRRKSKDIVSRVGKKTAGWLDRRAKAVAGIAKRIGDTWINKRRNPNGPTILASNEAGTHLFIEGGDQSLDLGKVGLADQSKKETAIVGPVHYITYHSRKKFDGKEEEHDYEHEFSEESNGPRPQLRYDVKNRHMFLDGGMYYIPKPFFGASAGITD